MRVFFFLEKNLYDFNNQTLHQPKIHFAKSGFYARLRLN